MLSLFLAAFGATGTLTEALEADAMVAEVLRAQGRLSGKISRWRVASLRIRLRC